MMRLAFFEKHRHTTVKLVKHVSLDYGAVSHNNIEKKS